MRKKYSFLIATSIFLLLLVPSISIADIDDAVMTPGDTFIYSVKEFDVPWEDLFVNTDSNFMGYPIQNFVLDLSGSTFGVKVMGTDDRNGYYMLNPYVILGKDIEIPIPEESLDDQVQEIFGDTLVIPEGVGLGMASNIPGSDYLEFIDANYEDYPGVPFYFDADEWNQYEDMFEEFADELDDADTGLELTTDEKDDEFIVAIEGSIGEGAQYSWTTTTEPYWYTEETSTEVMPIGGPDVDGDISFEVAWHASGKHAGVFKRVNGNFEGDIGEATNLDMQVEVSFDEKRENPLPQEILDEETITLEMDQVSFTHDTTGFFADHEDFQDQLDNVDDTLQDAEGEDMFVFEVTDVEGCYYETDIEFYEGEDSEGVWWNGFIGAPGWKDEWIDDPWEDWYIYATGGRGIIPLGAPGITPDWDMWQASTLSISSVLEFVEKAMTSSDAEDSLEDVGVTLNEFDIQYEMRGNKDYKFFYFTGEVDFGFDSDAAATENWPYSEDSSADVQATFEMWLGYTDEGLIVSIGANLMVEASFDNFPFGPEEEYPTYEYSYEYSTPYEPTANFIDGSFKMELNAEIKNKDIKDIPDPTNLPKDTEGEDGDGGGLPTPGFSVIPALILVAAISVIIKRRK